MQRIMNVTSEIPAYRNALCFFPMVITTRGFPDKLRNYCETSSIYRYENFVPIIS